MFGLNYGSLLAAVCGRACELTIIGNGGFSMRQCACRHIIGRFRGSPSNPCPGGGCREGICCEGAVAPEDKESKTTL